MIALLAALTAASVTGTVTAADQPVTAGMALAPGATVDTSAGTLVLQAARKPSGTQSLTLTGGLFTVDESGGLVKLVLQSKDTRVCLEDGRVKRKLTAATSSGRFELTARWAKVTVEKGRVTVSDKCQTTTVKVEKGSAKVRDLAKKRTLTLKAGKRITVG
jgi:ferric-dicitrate binding protein FerR (iron transport regulator)